MSWKKKKVHGNIVIYGIFNRLSMFMVISNIDFSYFIYIYIERERERERERESVGEKP